MSFSTENKISTLMRSDFSLRYLVSSYLIGKINEFLFDFLNDKLFESLMLRIPWLCFEYYQNSRQTYGQNTLNPNLQYLWHHRSSRNKNFLSVYLQMNRQAIHTIYYSDTRRVTRSKWFMLNETEYRAKNLDRS